MSGLLRQARGLLIVLAVSAVLASCGGGEDDNKGKASPSTSTTASAAPSGPIRIDAQVASFDLVAGKPQRVLLGLGASGGRVVAGGELEVFFAFLGEGDGKSATGTLGAPNKATFQPIIGSKAPIAGDARLQRPSEGVGVYAVNGAVFDRPGKWGVLVGIPIQGQKTQAQGTFTVGPEHQVLAVGQPAPRTVNPLAGAKGVRPEAIDSRANGGDPIPDTELHDVTVADALGRGLPVVVVVSTPVYCESQFCGPITEEVEKLVPAYKDRATFIHLEVWEDFEKQKVGGAAAAWVSTKGTGGVQEPWVFVVDRNGTIAHRFDNIAGEAELRAAIDAVTA